MGMIQEIHEAARRGVADATASGHTKPYDIGIRVLVTLEAAGYKVIRMSQREIEGRAAARRARLR